MTGRSKNEGRIYLRRSDSKQESSLETQLQWGIREAKRLGVPLEASLADLDHMISAGLHHYRHIYLDNAISGADLQRPGLTAMVAEAQINRKISHIFAYKRDRLGRPDNPLPMMMTENSLSNAGVTIVFCDGQVDPTRPGETDLPQIIHSLFGYHASGEYLKNLADRIILGHRNRAQQGYRTGGNAPYGFVRVLVDPAGEVVEELPKGKVIRQEGHWPAPGSCTRAYESFG